MSIYKRTEKSKFYWTRFEFAGREIRQSTKCTNKKDAGDFERALREQLAYGRIGIDQLGNKADKPLVFADVMADFLDNLETKESTKRRYAVASKALIEYFGKAIVSSINIADVERFRGQRKRQNKKAPARLLVKNPKAKLDKPIKPATVNRELMLLSGLFKWLVRNGKVSKNPVTGIKFLREENDQTRVVTDQEFRAYLMAASQPLRDVAVLMFETGMRPGEVLNLKKADIDLQGRTFLVSEGKTEAARRRIHMSDAAYAVLSVRYGNATGDLLFPGGSKADSTAPIVKLTNAHHAAIKRVNEAIKSANKERNEQMPEIETFRLYDLRHTYATHLAEAGVDIVTMTAIMGWSRIEMAKRYVHPSDQHKAAALAKLQSYRNPNNKVLSFQRTA